MVTAKIIDEGISKGDINAIYFYGAITVVVAFIALVMGVLAGVFASIAGCGFAATLRRNLFYKMQKFSFSNIDKFSPPSLITRLTTDVNNIQLSFQMLIRICVRAPLMMIVSIILCFSINVKISMWFLLVLVFMTIGALFIIKKMIPLFKKMFKAYDDLNSSVQENITSIRVVKGFAREYFENKKFGRAATFLYNISVRAETFICLNMPLLMTGVSVCLLTLVWIGSNEIIDSNMTTGNFTSMVSYVMSMLMSLLMASFVFVYVSMSLANAERINEVLHEEPSQKELEESKKICEVKDGSVDFKDVCFKYDKKLWNCTLYKIDLHIESGQTIGIIGATGSGKSTLVNLIPRFYDVDSGEVLVGGVNVTNYDMTTLRNNVSSVLQNNVLFSGTILENLQWGNKDATKEECMEACRLACCDDFVNELPDKLDAHIEQGGTNVSGGQRQRLCIARALLKKPKVLILDDSTSAVDSATEHKIRKAFLENVPDLTKIIISQRINSIQDADKIILIKNGMIEDFDTHTNLLKNNATYKEIYEAQMSAGGDFDEKLNA